MAIVNGPMKGRRQRLPVFGGAAASFSPDAAFGSALVGWWDADDSSSITQSGGTVSAWASKAGAYSLTQATAGSRPTYSATGYLGTRPGISSNGTQGMDFDAAGVATWPMGSTASTIAIVASQASASGSAYLFGYGQNSTGQQRSLGRNSTTVFATGYGDDHDSGVTWGATGKTIIWEVAAGTNPLSSLTIDGAAPVTTTLTTLNTFATVSALFKSPFAASPTAATIRKILIINRVLTSGERSQLATYLAQ